MPSEAAASDLSVGSGAPTEALVMCGTGDQRLIISDDEVTFRDGKGGEVSYSWEKLDFILPYDLSLASDKLRTFIDHKPMAQYLAAKAGFLMAIAAVVGLVYVIAWVLNAIFAPPYHWLDTNLGSFGDSVFAAGIILLGIALAPIWLPIVIGLFTAGGTVAALGNELGKATRSIIELGLQLYFGKFENGVQVIDAKWVKAPWGTTAPALLDLIILGIKLRRRGLT